MTAYSYTCRYPPNLEAVFFPPQTQDVPCCGDTDPLLTMTIRSVHSILKLLTYWQEAGYEQWHHLGSAVLNEYVF